MTARVLDVTAAQYHADPCDAPSLSSSIAHTIVSRSALHAWSEHPKLGNQRRVGTSEMNEGSIIHAMLLGKGPQLDVISADNYRKKATQELRDAALEAGRLPILERRYAELQVAVASIFESLKCKDIVFDGASEQIIEWYDNGVLCRSMLDHVRAETGQVFDLKTISSADPRTCSRHSSEYGYDIQQHAYRRAFAELHPEFGPRADFRFLFCEIEPPYAVAILPPSPQLMTLGDSRWTRAREVWRNSLATGNWPGYSTIELEPPAYAVTEWEMQL